MSQESLSISGILIQKGEVVVVNDKFKKREFVLELKDEVNGNVYTNYAKMQLVQNKVGIIDGYELGDAITASFNIKGNKWEKDGKVNYMTNLDVWKVIDAPQQYEPAGQQHLAQPQPAAAQQNFYNPSPENVDDLPF